MIKTAKTVWKKYLKLQKKVVTHPLKKVVRL